MRLGHFCLLWAIYVFFFFFLDTLSLVTPLNFLISLSFLKPLFIAFQDGIWSVCFNMVVCVRIQRRKKKKRIQRRKKKKNSKKQKKNSKKKRKKKRKSVKKKKIKRVLIKFWEVKCKEGVLLWRRRVEKKNVEWKFEKELTFQQILKTLLIIYLHLFLFHFLLLLPYIMS